jgi:hypothetical protein
MHVCIPVYYKAPRPAHSFVCHTTCQPSSLRPLLG